MEIPPLYSTNWGSPLCKLVGTMTTVAADIHSILHSTRSVISNIDQPHRMENTLRNTSIEKPCKRRIEGQHKCRFIIETDCNIVERLCLDEQCCTTERPACNELGTRGKIARCLNAVLTRTCRDGTTTGRRWRRWRWRLRRQEKDA